MGGATFGKYRLIAELGSGGMADVFLAVMAGPAGSGFSKLTVVKRLRSNLADDPELVEMLVDEARIAARLNHPNVVQTNEVGSVGNDHFISMEYLDGQPLHRIQRRAATKTAAHIAGIPTSPPEGPTSSVTASVEERTSSRLLAQSDPFPKECQYLVLVDTLAGLHHAHELTDYDGTPLQVVHRDVTPHNIFVTYEGQVKVVDFGIAKAVGRIAETQQGVVKGKVRYMAREQSIGQPVDRRADVFSVGVMLWEAATGRRLWQDMSDVEIVTDLVSANIPSSPRLVAADTPEEIDRICRKALAFEAGDRYATAEEFGQDLEQYLAESGTLLRARRMLGAVVNELFKDKRAEIKSIIEKQLTHLKAEGIADRVARNTLESGGSLTPMRASEKTPSASSVTADAAVSAENRHEPRVVTARVPPLPAPRLPLLAPIGVLIVAALVFVVGRSGVLGSRKAAPVSSAGITSGEEIRIAVATNPPLARVMIDGTPIAVPVDLKVARDQREHVLQVEAPGFESHVETVRFDGDVSRSVVLTAKAAPPAASSGRGVRWLPATPTP